MKDTFIYKLFEFNKKPSCRLFFGSIGFVGYVILIILCVAGHDMSCHNVDLIYHLGYLSSGLIGLSAFDLSKIGHNKQENK
jgi:hypothetical protein